MSKTIRKTENTRQILKVQQDYLKYTKKKSAFIAILIVFVFFFMVFSLSLGQVRIPFVEVIKIIFDRGTSVNDIIIWNIRMPRILGAILIGACLAISGSVMQGVLRNPLASSYTLGTSNAAALGAAIGIIFLGGGTILGQHTSSLVVNNPYIVSISAFLSSMICIGILILLIKNYKASPETIILTGAALSTLFSSALAIVQYLTMQNAFSSIVMWMFGDLGKLNLDQNLFIFIALLPTTIYFFIIRWDFNAMEAGDDVAKGLGINVEKTRLVCLILSTFITAIAISFVGIIGFIGLLAPHLVKRLIGNDYRFQLIGSLFMGSAILLIADTIGRNLFAYTIPVGIITSFFGGPLFIFILIRRHTHGNRN